MRIRNPGCALPWHLLRGNGAVERVAVNEEGLPGRLAVGLEHVDGLDGVGHRPLRVRHLDGLGRLHHHLGEEICPTADIRE